MHRVHVTSSNLYSVGYDSNTQILEIEFVSGSIYQYTNVPPSIHERLMRAWSKGSYHNEHIKGHFRYRRIH